MEQDCTRRHRVLPLGIHIRDSEFGTWNKTRRYRVLPLGIHTRDSESYTRSLHSVLKKPAFKLLIQSLLMRTQVSEYYLLL